MRLEIISQNVDLNTPYDSQSMESFAVNNKINLDSKKRETYKVISEDLSKKPLPTTKKKTNNLESSTYNNYSMYNYIM